MKKEIPMGVSQWKNHGKKYGYWDFWKTDIKKKIEKLPKYMENGQPLGEAGRFIRRADVLEEIE